MNESEREIVTREMIRGFNDCALEAGTLVTGGQSVMNPWPIIGGTATVVCHEEDYVKVNQGQPGDQLILTKPLGTQVAVNLNEWLIEGNQKWEQCSDLYTPERAKHAYHMAVESMATLNKNGAALMKKYKCHGATDVTGFGLRGHAQNLCNVQVADVNYRIDRLPIFDGMEKVNNTVSNFRLVEGYSAETSGGLLMMVPPESVQALQDELKKDFG